MIAQNCYTCEQEGQFESLPPREKVGYDEYWRVAHAIDTALPGWLVLVPRRHIATIAELTDGEALTLGLWQVRLSRALHELTGCVKTYVIQFAEREGFSHVHFHLVPRMPDLPLHLHGPNVFDLMCPSEKDAVSTDEMNEIAIKLGHLLQAPLPDVPQWHTA
ncbi:HIT family protein [Nonomuraea sp. MG754425]|uniref:HIT family protein n=1 Tax=Nonomuraea sp. MG754425 TaxID=2570319 RepID=UPI001F3BEF3D|nr:HIT family protein [Nonomuraea sp. MG754425]MCF6467720.1 HIT family protein [Nonomuraea sp. MG754425]